MITEVTYIKEEAKRTEEEFRMLMEERNEAFMKIEKIKNSEIQKLNSIVNDL